MIENKIINNLKTKQITLLFKTSTILGIEIIEIFISQRKQCKHTFYQERLNALKNNEVFNEKQSLK